MAQEMESKIKLEAERGTLPSKVSDGAQVFQRGTRYGEAGVASYNKGLYALCDEGSYFTTTNPTPRTGIAGHAAPVIADGDTKSFIHMRNGASSDTGSRIYLDFIKLTVTVAGAGATDQTYKTAIDTGSTRVTSGGTTMVTVNPNMQSSRTTAAVITCGAVVTAAASASERELASGVVRTVVPVVGDVFIWDFGATEKPVSSNIIGGTAVANVVIPHCPVILGPSDIFLLHLWGVSQSGAHSYEVQMGWYER